jgi:hypothetical protein
MNGLVQPSPTAEGPRARIGSTLESADLSASRLGPEGAGRKPDPRTLTIPRAAAIEIGAWRGEDLGPARAAVLLCTIGGARSRRGGHLRPTVKAEGSHLFSGTRSTAVDPCP